LGKEVLLVIVVFFIAHWAFSVFMQSFFLHRYAAHKMYTVGRGRERLFHFVTWFAQGSSYLVPRAYAILHREHHAFSDTELDPHSPHNSSNPFTMMWKTKQRYGGLVDGTIVPESRFLGGYPEWPLLDRIGQHWLGRLAWIAAYAAFYAVFAHPGWLWVLFPFTIAMGPVHGAIVNWCGHKYGYRNFNTDDGSKNTLAVDVLAMGELFQNNHHMHSRNANFAQRWFEMDPTFQIMRVMDAIGIITLLRPKTTEPAVAPVAAKVGVSR
jgi:stearoyl-CoA desaturase (Delta-9 desaturase)